MPGASLSGIEFTIKGNADSASNSVKKLTENLNRLKSVLASDIAKFAKFGGKSLGKLISAPLRQATTSAAGLAKGLGGVLSGFKRIVGYRIIRSVIKEITQGFSEGIKNLYGWSRELGGAMIDGKTFADTMNGIATSMLYLKNSVGAAAAPFISALAPAIDYVIDKAVALLNVINQLMALFSGATSWNRAIKKSKEFGEAVGGAGGAAKEAMRYLAPFDELNRLPDDRSGGGGGGGTDYSGMFEETTEFMEGLKDFVDTLKDKINKGDWKGVGELIGNKVNEIVDSIPWATAGAKVGSFINALFTTRYWTLETINFKNIGAKVAEFLNNSIANIDFDIVGRTLTQKFTIIGDFIIGAVQNIDWGSVGQAIGNFMRGAFNQFSEWFGAIDWKSVGYSISSGLINAISNLDVISLGESLFNFFRGGLQAAFDLLIGSIEGLFAPVIDRINGFLEEHPFLAELLGINNGVGTGIAVMGGSGILSVDVDAQAVKLTDNIPKKQKVITGNNAKIDKITDETTAEEKTFPTTSKFVKVRDALTQQAKTLLTTSKFAGVVDALSVVQKTFSSVAKFNSRTDALTISDKTFNTKSNFTTRTDSLSTSQKTFNTTANFVGRKTNSLDTTIATTANFTSRNISQLDTTMNSKANFNTWSDSIPYDRRPWIDTKAKFTSYDVAIKPTIDVTAHVRGSGGNYTMETGGAYYGNKWHSIPQAASGGKFHGTLFWAGENGAEVVGNAGGRTEVLNRSQLAATMYSAVQNAMSGIAFNVSAPSMATGSDDGANEEMLYRAMLRALNDSDYNDRPIQLDGYSVYQSVVKRNRQEQKRMGVNPMMSY